MVEAIKKTPAGHHCLTLCKLLWSAVRSFIILLSIAFRIRFSSGLRGGLRGGRCLAISDSLLRFLRLDFHFFDVLVNPFADGFQSRRLIRDHSLLAGQFLVAINGRQVKLFIRQHRESRVLIDVRIIFALLHIADLFAVLYRNLVNQVWPAGASHLCIGGLARRGDGGVSHIRLLHPLARCHLFDLFTHDHIVDFSSDFLKLLVHLLVKSIELLRL